MLPKITIGDDDSVAGPNGKTIEELVEEVFKAKPFLKVADNTAGAGTKAGGGKSDGDSKAKKKTETSDSDAENQHNGYRKPAVGAAVVAALMAQKAAGGDGP